LLVRVPDAGTGLPLSDATVTLTGTGYAQTAVTNLGYTRQTDWSGGYGQSDFSDQTKYWSQDTNIDVTSAVGDLKLKKVGEKRYLDIFVTFNNPGLPGQYDNGQQICNIAVATSESAPEVSDDACLILKDSCIKECV
jgi:hypothetical protein